MRPDTEAHDLHEDEEEDFKAHRETLNEHGDSHGTEMGWLVSYADMMTLLTGLFVLLFSLAKQGSGTLETTMKKVSDEYFGQGAAPTQVVTTPNIPVVPIRPPITTITLGVAPVKPPITTTTVGKMPADELADAMKETKEELKKTLGREKAAKAKIKVLEDKLIASTSSTAAVDAQSSKMSALETQVDQQKTEIQELQAKLSSSSSVNQRYVAVMLSWETEKHDVDLYITTPSHKTFNFKNREFAREPGRFEIDSRFGPGIEMWKAEKFEPGVYKIRSKLYSQNGNTAKAKVKISIVTNSETYKSENFELKDVGAQKEMSIEIDEKGHLKVLP